MIIPDSVQYINLEKNPNAMTLNVSIYNIYCDIKLNNLGVFHTNTSTHLYIHLYIYTYILILIL